ncbi:MAG TPA: AAA family ATPase [Ktedonobacterales bacterium]|nr:AAA family ATPase [Ktedonobacterales bacterium]
MTHLPPPSRQPTLYIMCGLPYSGKTTFARRLSEQTGYPVVSIDDIRESLGFYWGRHEADSAGWQRIFTIVEQTVAALLQTGKNVIYNSTNHDKASRLRFADLARSLGCHFTIIFLDTPREVIQQRRQQNLLSQERSHIPDQFFTDALLTFEPPTEDEAEAVIRPESLIPDLALFGNKLHFVYVLSCADGTLYTGYTTNVARRLATHNAGKGARYTRGRRPVALLAQWAFASKGDALRAERAIKLLPREEKLRLVQRAQDEQAVTQRDEDS